MNKQPMKYAFSEKFLQKLIDNYVKRNYRKSKWIIL